MKKNFVIFLFIILAIVFGLYIFFNRITFKKISIEPSPTQESFTQYSKAGERCHAFNPGKPESRDCNPGLSCKLDNPSLPDLGGICIKD